MAEYYIEGNSISPKAAYETYSVNAGKALGEDFSLKAGNEAAFCILRRDPEKQVLEREDVLALYIRGKEARMIRHPILNLIAMLLRRGRKI